MSNAISMSSGAWPRGCNSLTDPLFLPNDQYVWGINITNRGGIPQTRPGYSMLWDAVRAFEPRGFSFFKPNGETICVKVIGTSIRHSTAPFTSWRDSGLTLDDSDEPVYFAVCVKNLVTGADGGLTIVPAKQVMIIQTGNTQPVLYDGTSFRFLRDDECPIGTHMAWVGNRLWVAVGKELHASNLLEPDNRTEENLVAGGGFFTLPDDITGLGVTPNIQSLLAFTGSTTTSFAASILDRSTWGSTPNFQNVILPDIGCIASRTVINQYGMLWWLSEGGVTNLDEALTSYRTSKIHYKDGAMMRSRDNFSDDLSRACAGAFGNFLFFSVPSGHTDNAHTWVMDNGISESSDSTSPSAWAGVWTGTFPVQWATVQIDGKHRCFQLSRDEIIDSSAPLSNIWEAFIRERIDFPRNSDGTPFVRQINCLLETKFITNPQGASLMKFDFAELLLSELAHSVTLSAFYSSRHSGYLQVMNKAIVATANSIVAGVTLTGNSYVKQRRRVRTTGAEAMLSDLDACIEDIYTRNIDRGFSILLKWTGELALDYIIVSGLTQTDEARGRGLEPNETTQRFVAANGQSAILATSPVATIYTAPRISSEVSPVSSRVYEEEYRSL